MRKNFVLAILMAMSIDVFAQSQTVESPDNNLKVKFEITDGTPLYSVSYKDKQILEDSKLGLVADIGDYSQRMTLVRSKTDKIHKEYSQDRIKVRNVVYDANTLTVDMRNENKQDITVEFRVSDNAVAFRYKVARAGDTGCLRVMEEKTGFKFPSKTTTFICPQSDAMIGWKRSKPSYEEVYKPDAPMTEKSQYGHGYTFPCLFRIGDDGWALVSETGLDSKYCGCHLSDLNSDGAYQIALAMPEENNGNGTAEPAFALPGYTPWRTIVVGDNLKPIVENTAAWDNVEPLYEPSKNYKFGKSTWSWIVWQDNSMNYNDQSTFIDLAGNLGYNYILIDAGWDTNIGREGMKKLSNYAHSKNVEFFVWYSSSGYWNDIVQTPINIMDNPILRKKEMKWLNEIGAKGIKVDFFGGDKQETIRLYEQILSDANDYGLMVIFHGCTIPRGWERMYPNYVGSEAVLASENLIFSQDFCNNEPFNACLHPFIRNSIGCMEYGGCVLNKRLNKGNDGGTTRVTTDAFELATTILYQNPIQNFAITPNNLDEKPDFVIDFMKNVPTTWEETKFIDGYPGKYVVIARKSNGKWYIAGVTASKKEQTVTLNLPMLGKGKIVTLINDNKDKQPTTSSIKIKNPQKVKVTMQGEGGFVIMQ